MVFVSGFERTKFLYSVITILELSIPTLTNKNTKKVTRLKPCNFLMVS